MLSHCCDRPEYAGLPRRHGHIFAPSWDYTGPHETTLNGSSKTLLHPAKGYRDLSTAVYTFWMRFLPSSLLPGTVQGAESVRAPQARRLEPAPEAHWKPQGTPDHSNRTRFIRRASRTRTRFNRSISIL